MFIHADLIAAGLAPFNPESAAFKAGRLMLQEIDECVAAGHDYAFETGLKNFNLHYCYPVDSWMLYDNSGMTPKLLDWSYK